MNAIAPVAQFDSADAAYLLEAFLTIYRTNIDHQIVELAAEDNGGQVGLYGIMWDTATACATACMAIDFSKLDVGVFAYEVLAEVTELSLSNVFFWRCAIGHESPDEVLAAYALLKGWPLLVKVEPETKGGIPVVFGRMRIEPGTMLSFADGPREPYVSSIQLQTTIDYGEDVEVCDVKNPKANQWSVYARFCDGLADHLKDFPLAEHAKAQAYALEAARQYGVEVDPSV